jgi:presequence protease
MPVKIINTMKNFSLTKELRLEELNIDLKELRHTPSGAEIVHLGSEDPENLFCISLRTLPESSNGVAHILEHVVLCGSKKYPVRDPFFSMTRRSLNTYMNALTGSDFTCYPAASQVEKDFYNLLSVYLDAVFYPNLDQLSFLQEGHRLEVVESGEVEFKGVVYNEMKGALTNPQSRLWNRCMECLFPTLTYRVESGGDPKDIPNLSYEEFLAFHKTHYHPSRTVFYFYGNLPLEKHLTFLEENILKGIKPLPLLSYLPKEKPLKKVVKKEYFYPVAPGEAREDQAFIAFGWLTCLISNQEELLALHVLESVLFGTDAALVKYPLLQSGLCKQVSIYMDSDMSEVPLLLVFKGCEKENIEKLEVILFKALEEVCEKEIPLDLIDAALHQLEFDRCEISSDYGPYGLTLFFRSVLLKQQGGEVEDGLLVHSLFENLKLKLKDPGYLHSLIKKYLINNSHRVSVVMSPSESLSQEEEDEEKERLCKLSKQLKEEDKEYLKERSKELSLSQEKEENVDLLPKVSLKDVPESSKDYLLSTEEIGGVKVYHHPCFTNGFVYSTLSFNLPYIKENELSALRLFILCMGQVGSGDRTYKKQLDYMQATTGGVGASLSIYRNVEDPEEYSPTVLVRGKALERNSSHLWMLLNDMIYHSRFDEKERFKELIEQHYISLEQSLTNSAMRYVVSEAQKDLAPSFRLLSAWSGIDYYRYVRHLINNMDKELPKFIAISQELYRRVFSGERECVITCDEAVFKSSCYEGISRIGRGNSLESVKWKTPFLESSSSCKGSLIASPVAFTCCAFSSISYSHPMAAALSIASQLMENTILHKRIREQGGAYGSGAVNQLSSGSFYFYAYRDPHLKETLKAFKEGAISVGSGKFLERELEEAKLCVIQGIDSPVSPGSRGSLAYVWMREGKERVLRQKYREALINTTKEDVIQVLLEKVIPQLEESSFRVFSGKEFLEREGVKYCSI